MKCVIHREKIIFLKKNEKQNLKEAGVIKLRKTNLTTA